MIFEFGARQELQLLVLLVTGAALLILAGPLRIPYPILLVLGGLLLAFGPGVPKVTMPPEVVLVGILPPLLYTRRTHRVSGSCGGTCGRSRCSRSGSSR